MMSDKIFVNNRIALIRVPNGTVELMDKPTAANIKRKKDLLIKCAKITESDIDVFILDNYKFNLRISDRGYPGTTKCEITTGEFKGDETGLYINIAYNNLLVLIKNHYMAEGVCYDDREFKQKTEFTLARVKSHTVVISKRMPQYTSLIHMEEKNLKTRDYEVGKVYSGLSSTKMYIGEFIMPITVINPYLPGDDVLEYTEGNTTQLMSEYKLNIYDTSGKPELASKVIETMRREIDESSESVSADIGKRGLLGQTSIMSMFTRGLTRSKNKQYKMNIKETWLDVDIDWYKEVDDMLVKYKKKVIEMMPLVMDMVNIWNYMHELSYLMMKSTKYAVEELDSYDIALLRIAVQLINKHNKEPGRQIGIGSNLSSLLDRLS